MRKIFLALATLAFAGSALSACAPLIGAGAAVGADAIAEDQGKNLF